MPETLDYEPAIPANNTAVKEYVQKGAEGKAMRALRLRRNAALRVAKLNGVKPATIVNFNPVPLRIENGGLSWKYVPAATDPELKSNFDGTSNKLRVKWGGHVYVGSYITIREPQVAPRIRDCVKGQSWDDPLIDWDTMTIKPIEAAHHFWTVYNLGNSDSCNMGGVLVYEGDRHTLDKAIKAAAEKKDESAVLMIPRYEQFEMKDRQFEREFFAEPKNALNVFAELFTKQKDYCMSQLQIANAMDANDALRPSITEPMRKWDHFAVDMKWKESVERWTLHSGLTKGEGCKSCGAERKRTDAVLCGACGRYYDPLESFIAGKDVPMAELYGYKDDKDVNAIKAEIARRESIFAPKKTDSK